MKTEVELECELPNGKSISKTAYLPSEWAFDSGAFLNWAYDHAQEFGYKSVRIKRTISR